MDAHLQPLQPSKLVVTRHAWLKLHTQPVYTLQGNPAKPGYFISAGADRQVVEWNAAEPETARLLARSTGSVYALALDGLGKRLCIGQNHDGLNWLDLETRQTLKTFTAKAESFFFIEWTPHGWLAGTSAGRLLRFDQETLTLTCEVQLSSTRLRAIVTNPNKTTYFVADADGWIYALDAQTLNIAFKQKAHDSGVLSLCLSPNKPILYSAGRDAHLYAWEIRDEGLVGIAQVSAHLFSIHALAITPDGRMLATGSMDKTIKIWNPDSLELIKVIDQSRYGSHSSSVNKLLWLPKPDVLVSCSDDCSVALWRLQEPSA